MTRNTDLGQFGSIDQTDASEVFVQFLDDASAEESFRTYKSTMQDWLSVAAQGRILDVGCGTGDDVRAMASAFASSTVIGVDNSNAMIAEAKRRGVPANVEFQVADATGLPFPDGSFQAVRADRSLMHVPESRDAVAEMVRVTQGRVIVYEVDFETLVIDVPDRDLARRVVRTWCDGFRDGWLGRRMPGLFAELGLTDIQVLPHVLRLTPTLAMPILGQPTTERAVAAGTITRAEADVWLAMLNELQQSGQFFSTLTGYLVAGTSGG